MSALNFRAILAGAFGAGASCFAKLSFDSNSNLALAMRNICYSRIESVDESDTYNICEASSSLTRGLTLLLMVGCNVLMVGTFVEGMTQSGSTIATALSTGSNFVLSAVFGILIFKEVVNYAWVVGFSMILLGVGLLSTIKAKK
ncbi:hypothetical protein CTEN210_17195 [Chaetoceros tenuissimus]|uniref:EamA domain-containing protein n=1 Tax=Chaetoceros tenuissimus TaxID=426638 RepID=A0AAD3DDM7_9STRA|nr:hypothetical protein CTEN210_17195 [Chaetoceros tenuissimus]